MKTSPDDNRLFRPAAVSFFQAHLLFTQARFTEAEPLLRELLRADPSNVRIYNDLGLIALQALRYAEAHQYFADGLQLDPDSCDLHNSLSLLLVQTRQWKPAEESARTALRCYPEMHRARINLSAALLGQDRYQEALDVAWPALPYFSGQANIHFLIGTALLRLHRLPDAEVHLTRALELMPNFLEARNNYGIVLRCLGRFDEAHAAFAQVLKQDEEQFEAHINRATLWLLQGRFDLGWKEYNWRCRFSHALPGAAETPRWMGQPFPGQTVLLTADHGFGDTLQFVRFARQIKQRGGHVILECPAELVRLMQGAAGVDEIITRGSPRPPFDFFAPLLGLPEIFCPTLDDIPAEVPYLHPSAGEFFPKKNNRLRVGLVWAGNPTHLDDRRRSCPPEFLQPLWEIDQVDFVGLQKISPGKTPPDFLDHIVKDGVAQARDFYDTACVIQTLDLVISVDTAVAHLTGALGKPLWLLVPRIGEWRWLLERSDSPWYPTARLFRQPGLNDWPGLIAHVKAELLQLASRS